MYSYLMFHMRDEFYDALLSEWVVFTNPLPFDSHVTIFDFDMMYCGGGPL